MPVDTGFGQLTIGKNVSIDITLQNGRILELDVTTGFDKKQETTSLNSKGLDGIHRVSDIPDGWTGTITLDRGGPVLDDYFAAVEAGYYRNGTLRNCTITETIEDVNDVITQYKYLGVSIKFADAGKAGPDQYVTQSLSWRAAQRIKVL